MPAKGLGVIPVRAIKGGPSVNRTHNFELIPLQLLLQAEAACSFCRQLAEAASFGSLGVNRVRFAPKNPLLILTTDNIPLAWTQRQRYINATGMRHREPVRALREDISPQAENTANMPTKTGIHEHKSFEKPCSARCKSQARVFPVTNVLYAALSPCHQPLSSTFVSNPSTTRHARGNMRSVFCAWVGRGRS
jgi:hypothetical protein